MAMEKKYMKCNHELPLLEAAKLLLGVGRRNLVVTDEKDRMLGTLSVSDILRLVVSHNYDWSVTLVGEVMMTEYIFLNAGHTKNDAIEKFKKYKIDYLPVLNKQNILVGIEFIHNYL